MAEKLPLTDPVFHKNVVILSGHGVFPMSNTVLIRTEITVPVNFTVSVWTWHYGTGKSPSLWLLDDEVGTLIDSGKFEEACNKVNGPGHTNSQGQLLPITYKSGEKIANLMILPPDKLVTGKVAEGHRLYTVDRKGTLEDFLANMVREYGDKGGANIHWSACAEKLTAKSYNFDAESRREDGTYKTIIEVASVYYEKP